jgi:adenine deaminase
MGLVQGFGFDVPCAVATTVAHDCHQMIIVGTNDQDMALAGNRLAEIGGGQVVVREGAELGLVHLPIAGLLSDQPVEVVANQAANVLRAFQACGCKLNDPNMQLSLLALVVIPELRISDLGLVDVNNFSFISLFEATTP